MIRLLLLALLALAACGRPLTDTERAYLAGLHGSSLDTGKLRIVKGAPVAAITFRRTQRPRVTCRERILPPVTDEVITSSPAAVALFNRIFFVRDWYAGNYLPDYPDKLHLVEAMLLAHEATHIWQWQNRRQTGYHPLRAAAEHGGRRDPYLFDLEGDPDFLTYGFEQQGAIIEEYVCCRALAPQAARTRRLHGMLAAAMPVSALPQSRESDVYLPWKNAELRGICD
ncbi:hypothetical protein [Leisingera methylohalidivorans]|uniref:DUF4157 domain-containing protein n=1 Tax=Leisingera methylohalidivorans DSM 14336 TaxID=999552 RepID=V9VU45_9RHOB|nr:hypothetical protein [Leisingera methylohalidivorans]AHD00387.1 hypothetical protein METH_06270 [Leisingera methylohalidivorans DSM 14336]